MNSAFPPPPEKTVLHEDEQYIVVEADEPVEPEDAEDEA